MLFRIDSRDTGPLFAQLADAVRAEIAAGRLGAGQRLPSARDVAGSLGVNLHTVLHAYQSLRDEGLVQMHRGRGAVVTPAAERLTLLHDDVSALLARARGLGLSVDAVASLLRSGAEPDETDVPKENFT